MAATKLALLLALALRAQSLVLRRAQTSFRRAGAAKGEEKATCTSTKVCFVVKVEADGTPQWFCQSAVDKVATMMPPGASEHGAVICGPGSFTFSPMRCSHGPGEVRNWDEFDHNAVTVSSSGGDCPADGKPLDGSSAKRVSFERSMGCFRVDC